MIFTRCLPQGCIYIPAVNDSVLDTGTGSLRPPRLSRWISWEKEKKNGSVLMFRKGEGEWYICILSLCFLRSKSQIFCSSAAWGVSIRWRRHSGMMRGEGGWCRLNLIESLRYAGGWIMRRFKGIPKSSDWSGCLRILSLSPHGLCCDANAAIVVSLPVTRRFCWQQNLI